MELTELLNMNDNLVKKIKLLTENFEAATDIEVQVSFKYYVNFERNGVKIKAPIDLKKYEIGKLID